MTTRQPRPSGAGVLLAALAVAILAPCPGCGEARPEGASPIVQPDSVVGKMAISESEQLLKLRQQQEAKSRKRLRTLPENDWWCLALAC